jgi:hypothetical protein
MTKKVNFMKTAKAGLNHQSGSRHLRRKEEAIKRAMQAKSVPEAAKILRRMK